MDSISHIPSSVHDISRSARDGGDNSTFYELDEESPKKHAKSEAPHDDVDIGHLPGNMSDCGSVNMAAISRKMLMDRLNDFDHLFASLVDQVQMGR